MADRAVAAVFVAAVGAVAHAVGTAVGYAGRAVATGARAIASGVAAVGRALGGAVASVFRGGGGGGPGKVDVEEGIGGGGLGGKDFDSLDASKLTGKDCDAYRQWKFENDESVRDDQKNASTQKDFTAKNITPEGLRKIDSLCVSNNPFESLRSWDSDKSANDTYRWGKVHVRVHGENIMFHYENFKSP